MGDSSSSSSMKGLVKSSDTSKDDISKVDSSKDFLKAENPEDERVRTILFYIEVFNCFKYLKLNT